MNRHLWRCLMLAGLCALVFACGPEGPPRKQTHPVKGEVYVDGKPAANLAVTLHDQNGVDTKQPTFSSARTDDNGKFSISTYVSGDGVPEGKYVLTFLWGEDNLFTKSYGGPDKLNDRYSDPKTSKHQVDVKKGKPIDLGRIELTTQ